MSPGFAPQHLLTTLPIILDKTKYLIEHLDNHAATGSEFSLDTLLTALTFDIIGAVTMGQDFRAQVAGEESELLKAYMSIVSLYKRGNGPRIPGTNWFRERKQRGIAAKIERLLQDTVRREFAHVTSSSSPSSSIDARSVLGLSLQGTAELTPELLQQTSDNLRVFMFAGHDTTSILLQWAFYELSRSPKQRAALVAELDALFGPDTADDPQAVAAALLQSAGGVGVGVGVGGSKGGAELLGAMTYGAAVIKETLRLHPPAATVRMTPPGSGFELTLPPADGEGGGGKTVCADGCIMYLTSYVMQRDVGVWGDTVDEFVPERWLGDTSWMPAGAWRPFERGPRSCIGLELANIEAKVILALLARRYDFVKVGLGELDLDGEGLPVLDERGYHRTKSTLFSVSLYTPCLGRYLGKADMYTDVFHSLCRLHPNLSTVC